MFDTPFPPSLDDDIPYEGVERRRRGRALRDSEERFRSLVQATSAIVWHTPASGRFEEEQPAWAAYTGQGWEQYRGAGWLDAVHPDDQARTVAVWERALALRTPYEVEHRLRRHDGSYRHFWVRAIPITTPRGTIREWVGIHTDITERKAAEETARAREADFRMLADVIPQLVWTTRADGYHDYFNDRWYAYTGMPRGAENGWDWKNFLHPDDYDRTLAIWRRCLQTGEPYEVEYRFRHHVTGEYRWFIGRAQPIRDADGRIVRWFGTCTDIEPQKRTETERDRALAQARLERARLYEVFRTAPAAIAISEGPDHVVAFTNARYEELIGGRAVRDLPLRAAFPELAGQGFFELLDTVYQTGEPYVGRATPARLDRDGDGVAEFEGFFDFTYQPVRDLDGRVAGILTHAVEVTDQVVARRQIEDKAEELARLATQLEASNAELDQFAYVTSHDLKAPLRGIANLTQWIEEDLGERVTGESLEHMRLLKGRVHRMEGLIDGILTYSRAGRLHATVERVDTAALVRDVVELLGAPAGVVAVPADLPAIEAERVPLQQVFLNLIGNALKHGRADAPRVQVSWRDAGGLVAFAVRDNGPGIAPEFHERIWGIFQTLEARDKVEGTGIGLAVVRKLVESRGGRVRVESALGAGATFHFTWPKAALREHAES